MNERTIKQDQRQQLERLIEAFENAGKHLETIQSQWEAGYSEVDGLALDEAAKRYDHAAVQLAIYTAVLFRAGDL